MYIKLVKRLIIGCTVSKILKNVMSVRPSVCVVLGSHWTCFNEIWYLSILRKNVEKIQFSLKSDKNNGYFNADRYTFLITSRSFFLGMRNVLDKFVEESKHKFCVQ